jgi:hypothetical protein
MLLEEDVQFETNGMQIQSWLLRGLKIPQQNNQWLAS